MNFLEERILKDGIIKEGNVLKVDSFLNHQMDIDLFNEIGREFKKRFEGKEINKILTIEASGIDPCEVAPDHWRHIHNRLAAREAPRDYSPARHRVWLQRRALLS